ncbi:OmpA family protein [Rapidithrix thailandica]|uniref:OmpA family protein n=1 Tax=Rapidithrix thailandica TaxID=413964 RepID=A0AAW9S2A7_9BACT
MLRALPLFLVTLLFPLLSFAQDVQWAARVLDYSSEHSPGEFNAQQVVGWPSVLPGGGVNPTAWVPKSAKREEFIKVGFDNPKPIRQVAIAESYNPSAVYQVFLYDENGQEHLLGETFRPAPLQEESRMLNIFFNETSYAVAAVKVVLDCKAVPGFVGIDAIAISSSDQPVKAEVNLRADLNPNLLVERMSKTINSDYKEGNPLISPDGKTMYFTRSYHPGNIGGVDDPEDIWYSEWNATSGQWEEAKNMGAPINTNGPNFISSLTPDGDAMVVVLGNRYKKNGKVAPGVSVSTRNADGSWTAPEQMIIQNESHLGPKANFFLANNRKVMVMAMERTDTQGEMDLYVSFLMENGVWSKPRNLGRQVNSVLNEVSPFLASDDKTLYFSSEGHGGFGKQDIFVSRRLDDTWENWSDPENLGPIINSELDDIFFNTPPSGNYSYYAKELNENNSDIFRVEMPLIHKPDPVVVVKGQVFNSKTKEAILAKIIYERLPSGEEVGTAISDTENGKYQIVLPKGEQYGYRAEAEGFLAVSENIDLKNLGNFQEINKNLYLVPIEVGATVRVNNIFFNFDEYKLNDTSIPELNRLVNTLNEHPEMRIEISGHTDNVGDAEYNKKLSEKRVNSVLQFLLDQGIDKSRLEAVGFGEDKPLVSNDDEEEGREINRRVEFRILESSSL